MSSFFTPAADDRSMTGIVPLIRNEFWDFRQMARIMHSLSKSGAMPGKKQVGR
jgi:hypothetical protein